MITSFKKSLKSFVFDEDHILLGRIRDVIISPDNGKIAGFWISAPRGKLLVARPSGITQWSQHIIFSRESMHDPAKTSFWKPILAADEPLIRQKVYEGQSQQYIGKVSDFLFDPYSSHILQIVVKTGFLGFQSRIIDREYIEKIEAKGVFLFDTSLPSGAESL